jgi:hypothetical protein
MSMAGPPAQEPPDTAGEGEDADDDGAWDGCWRLPLELELLSGAALAPELAEDWGADELLPVVP